jgi:hypothetical protein
MIILPDLIWILIPKNGCVSLMREHGVNAWQAHRGNIDEAVLYVDGDNCHLPASMVPRRFDHLPRRALVRDPWTRTVSRWAYCTRTKGMEIAFDQFVEQRYVDPRHADDARYAQWGPVSWAQQVAWLDDRTAVTLFTDYDFRHSTNRSVYDDHASYYTPRLRDLVADYYADDIRRFGFSWSAAAAA